MLKTLLTEAGKIDSYYQKLLDNTDNNDERCRIYYEFSAKLDQLEQELYLHTDFDMWELLCILEHKVQECINQANLNRLCR